MDRAVWTINNKNFSLILDCKIGNDKLSDFKFSPGEDVWTNTVPKLKFNNDNHQKEWNNFLNDLNILSNESIFHEIFINAKIGEESEYTQKNLSEPLIIRKIEEYVVDKIIE